MQSEKHPIWYLKAEDPLPPANAAWGAATPAPGLLALGGGLSVQRLLQAYGQASFPWYSDGQPIMWWSTDPRMTLHVSDFRLHRSLKKTLQYLLRAPDLEIRVDHDFESVIAHCATIDRNGQTGTWIGYDMIQAYISLHQAGFAHSVETWIDGKLAGGLYCVAIGKAVFGESMFALQSNASKIALAALVCLCKAQNVSLIDCQQKTQHLASLGAKEMPRRVFIEHVNNAKQELPMNWKFEDLYWQELLIAPTST